MKDPDRPGAVRREGIRKHFTPSERAAIAEAIEAELGNRRGKRTDKLPGRGPEVPRGETRNIAAKCAGFESARQYERATGQSFLRYRGSVNGAVGNPLVMRPPRF